MPVIHLRASLPFVYSINMRQLLLGSLSCVALACTVAERPVEGPRATPLLKRVEAPHETVAEPAPADGTGPGLRPEQISNVVLGGHSSLGGCHAIQFSDAEARAGAVTLAWTIQPDGSVSEASLVHSSFDSTAFHDCVLESVRQLKFPASRASTEVGQWEISFTARR